MPSAVIGALRVALGLDSAQFSAGATQAERRAAKLAGNLSKSLRDPLKASSALSGALAALGGALSIGALAAAAQRGLEYASSLAEVAQQLGVTTEDLQVYRYAATQVGVAQEEMDKGLAKLTVTMGKARAGVKEPAAAFTQLSTILGRDILRSAATAGDAIPLIADALAKVKDPAARAAIEVALFGKTGQKLDTLLAGGSSAVNELRDAAKSLGLVLSDEQIANADKTADKLSELKTVLEANIASAVSNNADAIYRLADAFVKLAVDAANLFSTLGNKANLAVLNNPVLFGGLGRIVKIKDRDQAFRDTLSNKAGRQDLFARNRQQRADLSAGRLGGLGAGGTGIANEPAAIAAERKRLKAERTTIVTAMRTARRAGVTPAPKAGRAGAGTSDADRDKAAAARSSASDNARRATEQAAERERQYQADLTRAEADELSAKSDLSASATRRAQIESDLLQRESVGQIEQIKTNKDLTDAQKAKLVALVQSTSALRQDLIDRRAAEDIAREALTSAQARLGNDQDILQAQAGLARTAKERGRIEMLILDKQFEALKLAEQAIIDNAGRNRTDQEIADAKDRMKTLGTLQGAARVKSARDNAGPIAQYLDGIPRTADEVNEALEAVAANGLSSIIDGLTDVEGGFKGLAKTVGSVANQIIASLLKIGLQKGIAALFGAIFPGQKTSLLQSVDTSAWGNADLVQLPGRAKGGSVIGGRAYMVGENGPEPFVPGRSGTIIPNDLLGGGGRFIIEPSPWFDVRAAGAAEPSIQSMGVRAAAGGSQMAQTSAARAARRRITR